MNLGQERLDTNSRYNIKIRKRIDNIDSTLINHKNDIKNLQISDVEFTSEIENLDSRLSILENSTPTPTENIFKSAKVYYNLTLWEVSTGTDNERQIYLDGKFLPISVVPFELSTATWRTYYITNWTYYEPTTEHPNGQTQILIFCSDPNVNVNFVGLEL